MMYKRVIWGYRPCRDADCLCLTAGDVSHLSRIYRKYGIAPESVDRVTVEFLLQREALARHIIKELDVLLKVGGLFEIVILDSKSHSSYTRSRDQVKYEMSLATDGRYRQTQATPSLGDGVLKLSYRKARATLPEGDSIDRWSFGIITNGKKNAQVEELIGTIASQGIPEHEVLVCGPFSRAQRHGNLTVLDDIVLSDDLRAPICAKKNRVIRCARYNNLCVLHDRFLLPKDWFSQVRRYGNFFDFLCLPTRDAAGRRFRVDWMRFCDPLTRTCAANPATAYSRWAAGQIIQGGIILGKKHLMERFMLDERLHWEELEDMHFSKMAHLQGAFINIDVNNCVISQAVNHRPAPHGDAYSALREWWSWFCGVLINYAKFRWHIRRYAAAGRGRLQTASPDRS